MLCAAAGAEAECDKLSVVDAKALTQEQLRGRICRDMTARNAKVDSANSFIDSQYVYKINGLNFVSRNNASFYYAWLSEVKRGAECSAAYQSNAETYKDLYSADPGCEEPHRAERIELGP